MIDSHCHLDSPRLDADRPQVLERAWSAGLTGIMVPAVGPHHWESLLDLPKQDSRIQVGLGIHPQLLPELPPEDDGLHLARLDALLGRKQAIAVGECGLDGGSAPGAPMERQQRIFREHLALARRHGLPLLVHCLRAHPEMVELLKEEALPEAGLLMHSYSGGADLARFYLKAGCHFSFAGPVTYERARKPLDAVREIPLDRLMVETDAPDQAPHPHRGGRSEPSFLPLIAAAMADAKGVARERFSAELTANSLRFFQSSFGG